MKSIAFICGSSPEFLGGIEVLQKNLIDYAKKKKLPLSFSWLYPGRNNRDYTYKGIQCHEIKAPNIPILKEYVFSRRVLTVLNREKYDVINTHANWGYGLKEYRKKKNQRIVHTYHGVTLPYYKLQFKRFGILQFLSYPFLWLIKPLEFPPLQKADELISVSEKVVAQLQTLYHTTREMSVLRTGVDLSLFKPSKKSNARKILGLDNQKKYLLYSGRGGYWNKGLDRAVGLTRAAYQEDKWIRLLVLGANENKCSSFLHEPFVIYRGVISRELLPQYYAAADMFVSLSRYEGGAPTLTLAEAVASMCPIVFSADSCPEIFHHKKDGLELKEFGIKGAKEVLSLLDDKKKLHTYAYQARQKIKSLSLDSWANKYLRILVN